MAAIQQWLERGPGGGGALFSPSINPLNGDEFYVSSDMGQVFRSTSEGASWQTVDFRQLQGSHNAKVQFTSNPNLRYALDYTDPSGSDGTRLMRSTDGGATWQPLAVDPTGGNGLTLVVDYQQPNRLIVADYSRMYFSSDGGQSWQQRFSTSSGNGIHVGGVFWDGSSIYVGTNQGLLVSTNGGGSFSVAPWGGIGTSERIVSLAGAKENGVTRLWVVTADASDVYGGVQGWEHGGYRGVYTIDVGQATWTRTTSGIASGATPFYVSAAINDIDTVYVAGGSNNSAPTVFRSTSGGQSWSSVLTTANNGNVQTGWSGQGGVRNWSYGENALGFAVSPLDSSRMLITDYGFAHLSEDGGTSWRAVYVTPGSLNAAGSSSAINKSYASSGLDNTSIWQVAWADATHMIGAYSDIRGAISSDGGQTWSFNYTGHTQNSLYRAVTHPATGVVYAATASVHDMYQSTHLTDASINGGTGRVLYSPDQGRTWNTLHDFGRVVTWVELDPNNPNRMYAAVAHSTDGGIYVSDNIQNGAASTWRKLTNPPRTEGHAFNVRVLNDGTLVATYSGRRAGSPLSFTPSSGVFVSTDGGQSWQDRSHTGMRYWTKDIVVDPHDASQRTWYATVFSGWGGAANGLGGLYRTTDRGQTWTRINDLDRVNSITISPTNANEAYLTTETEGLWYTENLNAANPTFTQVDGYSFRQPMRVFYNPYNTNEVWVTSFGGGLRVGYASPPTSTPGNLQLGQPEYTVNETNATVTITVQRTGGSTGAVSVAYATANGTATAGEDFIATSGVLSWGDGETGPKSFTVSIINDSLIETLEAFQVVLSNATGGATLGSPSQAAVSIASDDALQTLAFQVTSLQVAEGVGQALLTVTRTGGTAGSVSVNYATTAQTATAGVDFTPATGTLTFDAGETQKTIAISIVNDSLDELIESLRVTLSGASAGATVGANDTAILEILDDDEPPTEPPPTTSVFNFERGGYDTREDYGYRTVYIRRSGDLSQPATVTYATVAGSASTGSDFVAKTGTLTFAPGQSQQSVNISLVNDLALESLETMQVELRSPVGASLGNTASTTIRIADDEVNRPGSIQFDRAVYTTQENWGYVNIYLERVGGLIGEVKVNFATLQGTATAGQDYQAVTGAVTFADGQRTASFKVPLINNKVHEGTESLQLVLTNPQGGASLGGRATATLQIADDDPLTAALLTQPTTKKK